VTTNETLDYRRTPDPGDLVVPAGSTTPATWR